MLREAIFWPDAFEKERPEELNLPPASMDESAFRDLYSEIAPRLQGYIRKIIGNADLAEDIFQETFYKFLRADLPEMGPLQKKAYVFRIATSLAIDHWRRERRERAWKSLWKPLEARREEPQGDVMRALSGLKPAERALLWLAYVEEFNHREIASTLGLKEKSIRVQLFRARKSLMHILERNARNRGVKP